MAIARIRYVGDPLKEEDCVSLHVGFCRAYDGGPHVLLTIDPRASICTELSLTVQHARLLAGALEQMSDEMASQQVFGSTLPDDTVARESFARASRVIAAADKQAKAAARAQKYKTLLVLRRYKCIYEQDESKAGLLDALIEEVSEECGRPKWWGERE